MLPADLIRQIGTFLDLKDVDRFSQTCKHINFALNTDLFWNLYMRENHREWGFENLTERGKSLIIKFNKDWESVEKQILLAPKNIYENARDLWTNFGWTVGDYAIEVFFIALFNREIFKYIENPSPKMCLAAVQQNGWTLRYVKEQTPEICLAAVKQNSMTLDYVQNQTQEICLAAVKQDGRALVFVKEQTPEICLAAITQDAKASKYIDPALIKTLLQEHLYPSS